MSPRLSILSETLAVTDLSSIGWSWFDALYTMRGDLSTMMLRDILDPFEAKLPTSSTYSSFTSRISALVMTTSWGGDAARSGRRRADATDIAMNECMTALVRRVRPLPTDPPRYTAMENTPHTTRNPRLR
jgi:hypothetical protein